MHVWGSGARRWRLWYRGITALRCLLLLKSGDSPLVGLPVLLFLLPLGLHLLQKLLLQEFLELLRLLSLAFCLLLLPDFLEPLAQNLLPHFCVLFLNQLATALLLPEIEYLWVHGVPLGLEIRSEELPPVLLVLNHGPQVSLELVLQPQQVLN